MSSFDDAFADGFAVTPNDTTQLRFSALWVGGVGNVQLKTEKGTVIVLTAVPAGTLLRIRGTLVMAASTTATLIIGLI